MKRAHEVLEEFMVAQIAERKAEIGGDTKSTREDVFSLMVAANELDEGTGSKQKTLEDQELVSTSTTLNRSQRAEADCVSQLSNVFLMLLAGHETTAHTLAATLGLLSINPEVQQEIADEIIRVVGYDREPVRHSCDHRVRRNSDRRSSRTISDLRRLRQAREGGGYFLRGAASVSIGRDHPSRSM